MAVNLGKKYVGGYATVDFTDITIPASDNVQINGVFNAIKKAVEGKKAVLVQNLTIENIGSFTGYVTFMYDATNTAYIGSIASVTDYDGNGQFISLFLIVDNDDYAWVQPIDGSQLTPKATTSKEGTVKKCAKVTDATSETIVTQFNDLLSKMKTAGMMSN